MALAAVVVIANVAAPSLSFPPPRGAVVATRGTTLVAITATDTPATLTQIEALVNQLL
jgi:hypothetical protein